MKNISDIKYREKFLYKKKKQAAFFSLRRTHRTFAQISIKNEKITPDQYFYYSVKKLMIILFQFNRINIKH